MELCRLLTNALCPEYLVGFSFEDGAKVEDQYDYEFSTLKRAYKVPEVDSGQG